MGEQFAAQSVIEELLRHHAGTPKRNAFGRFFGYSPLDADSVSWYLGAKGEIEVGKVLATLPPEWTVFHDLPIGKKGSDIDHLVIGPGGIVTINTKNHSGKKIWVAGQTLMVSGQKVPYIRNADFEANRVTALLRERMPQLQAAQPARPALFPPAENARARFTALDTEVRAARVRRSLWLVAAFVAVFGGYLLVGPQLVTAIIGLLFSGAQ